MLSADKYREGKRANPLPGYLRWPHMQADQVRGLHLREIGGGFTKHHRAPSIHAACYAIAKPSTLVQKMKVITKMRGHQNAVYCGISCFPSNSFFGSFNVLSVYIVFFLYKNIRSAF